MSHDWCSPAAFSLQTSHACFVVSIRKWSARKLPISTIYAFFIVLLIVSSLSLIVIVITSSLSLNYIRPKTIMEISRHLLQHFLSYSWYGLPSNILNLKTTTLFIVVVLLESKDCLEKREFCWKHSPYFKILVQAYYLTNRERGSCHCAAIMHEGNVRWIRENRVNTRRRRVFYAPHAYSHDINRVHYHSIIAQK